jgi:hypothetical protein
MLVRQRTGGSKLATKNRLPNPFCLSIEGERVTVEPRRQPNKYCLR